MSTNNLFASTERLLDFADHGMQLLETLVSAPGIRVNLDAIDLWRRRVYGLQLSTAKTIMGFYLKNPAQEFKKKGTEGFLGFVFLRQRLFGKNPVFVHPKDHKLMVKKLSLDAYNETVAKQVARTGNNSFKGPAKTPKTKKKARETAPGGRLQSEKVEHPIVEGWVQRDALETVNKENGTKYVVV